MDRIITVTAAGKASAEPDYIAINLNLSAKDMDYTKLTRLAEKQYGGICAALSAVGFDKKDIRTDNFNVNTSYEYIQQERENKRVFTGYVCSQQLSVEFAIDMDRLARILQALGGCEADPEYSISFFCKNAAEISDRAAASACTAAKAKAKLLADSLDLTVGRIMNVRYNTDEPIAECATNFAMPRMMKCDAGLADMTPSDVTVSESVTCEFEII